MAIKFEDTYLPPLPSNDGSYDIHNGTSVQGISFEATVKVVDPTSVTPGITDLLSVFPISQKVVCKLYKIDGGNVADAPLYFGVGYRAGITDISCVNLFCHPRPDFAKMLDGDYMGIKGKWSSLFRYMQFFSVQLAAASSDMVVVMPMFTQAAWNNPKTFNAQAKEIVNGLLVEVQKLVWPDPPSGPIPRNAEALSHLILSDFSTGRELLRKIRASTSLATYLGEIWDFDGQQAPVPSIPGSGQLLMYNQHSGRRQLNEFQLPLSRWERTEWFFACSRRIPERQRQTCIHANFPRLFYHAAKLSRFGFKPMVP